MQAILLFLLTWVCLSAVAACIAYRKTLVGLWREPVLKHPVLIIESDDWGAGPLRQAHQLERIMTVLAAHSNLRGQKPVMTLGIVLSVPDGGRMLSEEFCRYYRKGLALPEFADVLTVMKRGAGSGVFALQLHGEEHYWPAALLSSVQASPALAAWSNGAEPAATEALPAALQSRWIDASVLPSTALAMQDIRAAALAEVESFRSIFGAVPKVAVPPTFVWNDAVEAAWSEAGVEFVVTPGRRFEARDARGNPVPGGPPLTNGAAGNAGVTYLVRDDYFEPARGHSAKQALAAFGAKTRLGRPTLLETHRANFLGDADIAEAAVRELDRLIALVLRTFPEVLFLSTEELAVRMRRAEPELVESRIAFRLRIWLRRLWTVSQLRKLACLTGIVAPAFLVYALASFIAGIPRQPAR